MKRTLKVTFTAFLKALDAELVSMGAEKYIRDAKCDYRDEVPGYRFETRHGSIEIHPSLPIRLSGEPRARVDYDLTVFGRFPDADRAAKALGHWKWNHHFGYRAPDEIEGCVTYLAQRLSLMLIPSPAPTPAASIAPFNH